MAKLIKYEPQEHLKPIDLIGISNKQIDEHWKLYVAYVNQVNKLNEEIEQMAAQKKTDSLTYLDRKRRYGFEYNGMVLHEYYFGSLCNKCIHLSQGPLLQEIERTWGTFQEWLSDFVNTGKSRGIGWVILYMDPATGLLLNAFISDHENGHIAGFVPLLVMDIWEHAYLVDHKVDEKGEYINSFVTNINWEKIQKRHLDAIERKLLQRF